MSYTIECWAVVPTHNGLPRLKHSERDAGDDVVTAELHGQSARVVHLIDAARLAEVERERNEARKLVKDAYDYGGGHWGDWGERALCVAEMLSDAIDSWRTK